MNPGTNDDTLYMPMATSLPELTSACAASALVQADVAGQTDQGQVRSNNEDHFLWVRFGRFLEVVQTSLPHDEVTPRTEEIGYGMIVADGIGGHRAGEEASR